MTARRKKVGIVATLMDDMIASLELAHSPLLPVIRDAQREETTHLLLIVKEEQDTRVYLLTAGHLLNLESLKDLVSLESLRRASAYISNDGLAGKPLTELSRRERTRLMRDLPQLRAGEFEALCSSAPMCHFSLAELLRLSAEAWYLRNGRHTEEEIVKLFADRFPREDSGFYKFGKPKPDSLVSFSMKPRRPQSEHVLYERRLKGVLVEI
ncbi:hypothetical protein E1281_16405 [Actinomadura sp. KC345]|uniref:hypothetical protein n=1 Tax=Actinomadura sp. KC345 TaxID=2530371 RepID=UPI001051B9BA|nr:hypothetical protein [Actinomadura sp. KC345]TDC54317.1 hypothetical protein E1281_16405 [Actinomadura sp. KC345]